MIFIQERCSLAFAKFNHNCQFQRKTHRVMGGHEFLYHILPTSTIKILQFHNQGGRKTDQQDNSQV